MKNFTYNYGRMKLAFGFYSLPCICYMHDKLVGALIEENIRYNELNRV